MKRTIQVVVSCAIVTVCTMGGAAKAQGLGQQWRPAMEPMPMQAYRATAQQRVANVPSFRPRSASLAQRYTDVQRGMRPVAPRYARSSWTTVAPQPRHYPAMYGPQYAAPAWSPPPTWGAPFGQMAQAWQAPVPMFARQFAWRPAAEPWAAYPVGPQPQHALPVQRPMVDYGEFGPASAAAAYGGGAYGDWRPVAPYQATTAGPGWAPEWQRPLRAAAPMRGMYPADTRVSAVGMWRPQPFAATSPSPRHVTAFRPLAYGRQVPDERLAARPVAREQQRLPGWVTTYADNDLCHWCSGS